MRFKANPLARAVVTVDRLSLAEQEKRMDRIHATQPTMLASVLVQHQMGSPLAHVDVLLEILLVIHTCLEQTQQSVATITEQLQIQQMATYADHLHRYDALPSAQKKPHLQRYLDTHPEPMLLTWANDTLRQAGLTQTENEPAKYCVLAGMALVNCYSHVALNENNEP